MTMSYVVMFHTGDDGPSPIIGVVSALKKSHVYEEGRKLYLEKHKLPAGTTVQVNFLYESEDRDKADIFHERLMNQLKKENAKPSS